MPSAKQIDEAMISFFDDELVAQADLVFRFGLALTLSLDGAAELVRETYRSIADQLGKLNAQDDINWKSVLIAECWRHYLSASGRKYKEGESAVMRFLRPLKVEQRAALVAVDVAGIPVRDMAKALGTEESKLRDGLAAARDALLKAELAL